MWNEKPRMSEDTAPINRAVPSQSSERRPERSVGCVGGIGEGGRKSVTITRQKMMTGSWRRRQRWPAASPAASHESTLLRSAKDGKKLTWTQNDHCHP